MSTEVTTKLATMKIIDESTATISSLAVRPLSIGPKAAAHKRSPGQADQPPQASSAESLARFAMFPPEDFAPGPRF